MIYLPICCYFPRLYSISMVYRFYTHTFICIFSVTRYSNQWGFYHVLANSMEFCLNKYQSKLPAFVFMPSHLHLLIVIDGKKLGNFMRDFKKYTSQKGFRDLGINEESIWEQRYDRVAIFSDSAPGRADLRAISSRLRLEPYSVPSQIADLSPEYADSVTVHTRDGRELRSKQAFVPGGPESPLSVETLLEKAGACFASGGVPKQSRRALCEALLHGPERRSVELLVAATTRK